MLLQAADTQPEAKRAVTVPPAEVAQARQRVGVKWQTKDGDRGWKQDQRTVGAYQRRVCTQHQRRVG